VRLAALQTDIVWEDPEANFARLEPWLRAAVEAGAQVVVLPEMFACGFSMNARAIQEPPDGPTTRYLRGRASEYGVWIAGSLPELPNEEADLPKRKRRPYNTLVLAGPGGEIHRYRKIRPFSYAGEDRHYGAGTETVTVELPSGSGDELLRTSLFICYDLRFADLFWDAAPETDLYLVVANWPVTRRHHWTALLAARAIENQAYVVGVNRVGTGGGLEYAGDSRIVDPMGEVLAAASGGETMLLADLHPARVQQVRKELPFLPDRQPRG
jgi:predicted amidohydrolase